MSARLIARNTFREATRDRMLAGVVVAGLVLLVATQILSPLALGEGRRLTVDLGLSGISLLGLLIVLLVGTSLVAKEVERRTIYNLLSRPIRRSSYLLGKWIGLSATLWAVAALLGVALWGLLCLRGSAMYPHRKDTGYYFVNHYALERETIAALDALEREHADRIAAGPALYAGFSQGAIMGALILPLHPERFRRAILIEGGYDEWDVPSARKLARGGTARVLFACGQSYCATHARRSIEWLRAGGVEARLELAPGAGHTYAGEGGERVLAAFDWVVAGDERWK
jgi:pimeloyl-ACP methyl ester carboxylesterase